MRRSLLVLLVVVAAGSVAVGADVVRVTTPARAVRALEASSGSASAERVPMPTPPQLLAASEPANDEPASTEPASAELAMPVEPPPDDVELLNEAIAAGDLEVVKSMIASGFPVNTDDTELREPLAVARDRAGDGDATSAKIVALLEQHGATARRRVLILDDMPEEPSEPDIEELSAVQADLEERIVLNRSIKQPMMRTILF